MRIAYLINMYPKISHVFIRREILAIEKRGIEVVRIAIRGWDGELVDDVDRLERDRTQYVLREGGAKLLVAVTRLLVTRPRHLIRALVLTWHMSRKSARPLPVHLIYLAEACWIALLIRKMHVSNVHAHFGTNSANVAMLVHELGGPPWSFTVHGPEEFDLAPIIGLKEKLNRCSFVVAISSYGRSQLYRFLEYQHWGKVHVVACGLDRPFFEVPVSPAPSRRRLVCVGRLCEQKGQILLVDAARQLASEGLDFELVLVGDGEIRDHLETLIARHNLRKQVRICGWMTNAQVRDEILAARALVLPSFAEGLPIVIMESMALKRPIISTYVGGIPELVRSGEHGWLVPAGDLASLVAAMRASIEAPAELLAHMGEAAQKRVSARHSVEVQADRLISLFRHTVDIRSSTQEPQTVDNPIYNKA
jgi:colanic acid/amylovoran biosynthesis glycosyltransferase